MALELLLIILEMLLEVSDLSVFWGDTPDTLDYHKKCPKTIEIYPQTSPKSFERWQISSPKRWCQ